MNTPPDISIVIPSFNEEGNVEELCERLQASLKRIGATYEVIFVDDLSADATLEKLEAIHQKDAAIKVIQFSRRFGYQTSIYAGLEHAQGNIMVTMDSDLQHPPELIGDMIAKCKEGYDVVNMVRSNVAQKSWIAKIGSKIFYRFINMLSPTPIPTQSADFRLYTRAVVNALKEFPERDLFLRGLVGWVGFRQIDMPFKEEARKAGKTKFRLWHLVGFATNAITAFSVSPLFAAVYLGIGLSSVGVIYGCYIILSALFVENYPAGWPTVVCLILLVGGLNMIFLGVIGTYIAKTFLEVKHRPRYIVGRSVGFQTDNSLDLKPRG